MKWTGSSITYRLVRQQIEKRWGKKAAENYNPTENCFTYLGWKDKGFQVKRGEKALRSITYVHPKDKETGEVDEDIKYPKNVFLFYKNQVEPIVEARETAENQV